MKELRFRLDPFVKKVKKDLEQNIEVLKTFIEEGVEVRKNKRKILNLKLETVKKSKATGGFKKTKGKIGNFKKLNKDVKFQYIKL